MFVVRLAELNIGIANQYHYIKTMCRDYLTENEPDFYVSVTDGEIQAEDSGEGFDKGYLESLAIYRKIAQQIITYGGFLLHGVVMEVNNCGVAFLAKSGVGKSTHAKLWQALLNGKLTIVNGDKPLVRIIDRKIFAYGTPWAGKESLQTNTKTELKKICFIERSENNTCTKLYNHDVLERLMAQIYKPKGKDLFLKLLAHVETLILHTEFYSIQCNTDISAAKIAYEKVMQ